MKVAGHRSKEAQWPTLAYNTCFQATSLQQETVHCDLLNWGVRFDLMTSQMCFNFLVYVKSLTRFHLLSEHVRFHEKVWRMACSFLYIFSSFKFLFSQNTKRELQMPFMLTLSLHFFQKQVTAAVKQQQYLSSPASSFSQACAWSPRPK